MPPPPGAPYGRPNAVGTNPQSGGLPGQMKAMSLGPPPPGAAAPRPMGQPFSPPAPPGVGGPPPPAGMPGPPMPGAPKPAL